MTITNSKSYLLMRLSMVLGVMAVVMGMLFLGPLPSVKAANCGDVQLSGGSWAYGQGVDSRSNAPYEADIYGNSCLGNNNYLWNLNPTPPTQARWGLGWQCVEMAQRMYQTRGWGFPSNVGRAVDIYTNAPAAGFTATPQYSIILSNIVPGDMLVTHEATYGHVMLVDSVNTSNNTINAVDQNGGDGGRTTVTYTPSTKAISDGSYYQFSGVVHSPNDTLNNGGVANNTVLQVKKITDSDGTNEVIWSKATDVFDSKWKGNSGISVNNLINISQGDIKSIDVNLYSNGEHDVFVATAHNIWEIWWYQGQGPNVSNILPNIGNLSKVIKAVGPDGTQQLYVLKDTGAYEYWWNSTSGGIQHDTVMTLANPVDEYKEIEADGTQALFVADQNYPYEQRWGSGISGFQQTTFSSVSGITSISFSQDVDAKHRYYIGSSSGAVWEASWYTGGGIGYWYMTGGPAVLSLQKWESDSTQVIYEATSGGVFEYSWPITSNTLSGRTIVGGLSSVHSFIRTTDPGNYQSVYTATGTNILESWWPQGSNTITTGQIE